MFLLNLKKNRRSSVGSTKKNKNIFASSRFFGCREMESSMKQSTADYEFGRSKPKAYFWN